MNLHLDRETKNEYALCSWRWCHLGKSQLWSSLRLLTLSLRFLRLRGVDHAAFPHLQNLVYRPEARRIRQGQYIFRPCLLEISLCNVDSAVLFNFAIDTMD